MRTTAIERATTIAWEDWRRFLTDHGAAEFDHGAIAALAYGRLDGKIDNPLWWAQSVAVAFEQEIGLRVPGQRSDGTFQTSVSRATPLDMHALSETWTQFATSDSVVQDWIAASPRVSGTDKRITWRAKGVGGSNVTVTSEPKKDVRASLIAQLDGLPSNDIKDSARDAWGSILDRLIGQIPND